MIDSNLIDNILDIGSNTISMRIIGHLNKALYDRLRKKLQNTPDIHREHIRRIFKTILENPMLFREFMDNDVAFYKTINTHYSFMRNRQGFYKIYDINPQNFINMSHQDSLIMSYWCFRFH